MSIKKIILEKIVKIEGGYVDDPDDSGGKTMYGITERVARSAGYAGKMEDLKKSDAYDIYGVLYWDKLLLDKIAPHSWKIAEELADTAVNCGVNFASISLQRILNVMNNRGEYWPDIIADGYVGKKTIEAFKAYMLRRGDDRGEEVLLAYLNALQGSHYVRLAERRVKDERFIYGWGLNRLLFWK